MSKFVTVEQALEALRDAGYWRQYVSDPCEGGWFDYIDVLRAGVWMQLPILPVEGVCEPTLHPFESTEKLISWCETTFLAVNSAANARRV